ncbi:MAG: hypothetical protein FGM54_00230 [Chitinophagaceae bacterium]|nr:hypothetical protein [Chitinophagaceae bacterium]
MRQFTIFGLLMAFVWVACTTETEKPKENDKAKAEACATGENPNGQSALAGMMRQMVNDCDRMRADILAGKPVDSLRYPMPPFIGAEPTEADMKTPVFYAYASGFEIAYRTLMSDSKNQVANYNALIQGCASCHNNFCRGPLKKINQLPIPE